MEKLILNTKYFILYTLIFLFPFFFLNITQEYFATNKLYFLGFGVLLLFLISIIQLIFLKKISWKKSHFNIPIILFLTSVTISTFFTPNKIQSILNPNFGLAMMIFLAILYFYVSQNNAAMKQWNNLTIFSSVFLSLITIIFYFQPFKNIALPQNLVFLNNPDYTPIGSQLDLAIILGFFVIWGIVSFLRSRVIPSKEGIQSFWIPVFTGMTFAINLLALGLTIYAVLIMKTGFNIFQKFPTFRFSWLAILEILKNPASAIIGVGPDNFSTVFTKIKDFSYNQSPLWQINSFYVSRSALFQITTETGIFGLLSFGLIIFTAIKQLIKGRHGGPPLQIIYLFIYLLICLLIFPSSLIVWFLFFVVLGLINHHGTDVINHVSTIDLNDLLPIYLGTILISLGLIGVSSYFLGRSYAAEYYFKKSLDGVVSNNIKQVYNNQRQAIILNPYNEQFRNSFAQINIFIANDLAKKGSNKISAEERQTITQAVQMAISEGKQLVKLNPKKAQYWTNLGDIYMNIIPLVKDSDVWAIASYQRAIALDPFNPIYQLNIGGVYFRIGKYQEAVPFFEEATKLKPDWSNAHYNLAWAYFRNKDYQKALLSMQNSVNLIDKNEFPKEWSTANRDFELFKNKLDE